MTILHYSRGVMGSRAVWRRSISLAESQYSNHGRQVESFEGAACSSTRKRPHLPRVSRAER